MRTLRMVAALALLATACDSANDTQPLPLAGGELTPDAGTDGTDGAPDVGEPDASDGADVTDPPDEYQPPAGDNVLTFADASCGSPCERSVDSSEQVELAVMYRNAGAAAIVEAPVSFETEAAELKLSSKLAYTTEEGRAGVMISANDGVKGTFEVHARVEGDPGAGRLTFKITATAEDPAPLKVSLSYGGQKNVPTVELRLYLQEGGKPLCSDVHPDAEGFGPTAVLAKSDVGLNATTTFPQLPGLGDVEQQTWMIHALGVDPLNPLVTGCKQGVVVNAGEQTVETVELADLPLKFGGTYDVVTWADMYTGISGDGGTVLGWLVELFDSPGAVAIKAACEDASGILDTACGFLMDGPDQLSALGVSVAEYGDTAFFDLMAENLGTEVTIGGQAIAALLKEMRFGSTLTLDAEPSVEHESGTAFGAGTVIELWNTVSFYWKFGLGCPAGDEECGLQTVKLSDIYDVTLEAKPTAGVAADGAHLWIDVHDVVGFNYGTLLNYIIEKKVLPLIFGDGTTGYPAVNSYELLMSVLFGDTNCIKPGWDDCCWYFSQKVQGQIPSWVPTEQVCELAIPAAGEYIRGLVTDLGGPLEIGTQAEGTCPAVEVHGDRGVDSFGSQSAPCTWDATFDISGAAFEPNNTWYGNHK